MSILFSVRKGVSWFVEFKSPRMFMCPIISGMGFYWELTV